MKVYWYELLYRGVSVGTQPKKGWVTSDLEHINVKGKEFGAVMYNRPLTEQEIEDYELRPIEAPRELFAHEKELLELMN